VPAFAAIVGALFLPAPPSDLTDLANATRDIFLHRCAECHGSDVPKPKGKFGFITDLQRLANAPEYIIPRDADHSDLWNRIEDGDMPPKKAKNGPLTQGEMETVSAWIAAGAPAPSATPPIKDTGAAPASGGSNSGASPSSTAGLPGASTPIQRTPQERAIEMLGRLHVVVIHFPIALLLLAAMAEGWRCLSRSSAPLAVVRTSLVLGCLSAIVAGGLGWIHARDMSDAAYSIVWFHRWLGTGTAGLSLIVMALYELGARKHRIPLILSLVVMLLAGAAGATAHFGGLITHGESFYDPLWR
jgi:mono/diheme cytochrome c family protein